MIMQCPCKTYITGLSISLPPLDWWTNVRRIFIPPPDFSAHSYLSPASPHVNIHTVKHHYGSKSRRGLFNTLPPVPGEAQDVDQAHRMEGPSLEHTSLLGNSYGGKTSISAIGEGSWSEGPQKKSRLSTSVPDSSNQYQLDALSQPTNSTSYCKQPMGRKRSESARIEGLQKRLKEKNKTINRLRMQIKRVKKPKSSSLSAREIVAAANPHLKPAMRILLQAQLKLSGCKKKGMRWSNEMKDFTLSLMYHGPRCYRYLAKLIPLPSISTINRYQSLLHLKPGIHEHVKLGLIENVKTWSQKKKICSLIIDGMAIKRHLQYDIKRDFVNGFTDDGQKRSSKLANEGLVAVFKGILSPWKQIIGHWLTADTDPAEVALKAVRDCVAFANYAGLILKLFICDPGSKNRRLVRLLGITEDKPYFMNGNEKVYFLWDPPHLIKNMRNNLLCHDLLWRGETVSWKYIKALHVAQKKMRLRLAPKLTDRHVIFRSSFSKMKVKLATQIFSNSVSVALLTFIAFNRLPAPAVHTATCCKDLNDLYDCYNSMQFAKDKLSLRYAIGPKSEHISFLKPKLLDYFRNAAFIGVKRQPFVLKDWQLSIQSLLLLVDDLSKNYSVNFIRTRLLSQDVLENSFSTLRQQHGCCDNPTSNQLEGGLRMSSLSSLMKLTSSSNCEEEMEKAVITLNKLPPQLFNKKKSAVPKEDLTADEMIGVLNENAKLDEVEESALYYCCGFLVRQFLRKHKCPICEFKLLVDPDERMLTENYQLFMYFKAHSSKLGSDFGNLKAPSYESFEELKKIDNVFYQTFSAHSHERNIALKIRLAIDELGLRLNLCSQEIEDEFLSSIIRIRILWEVRFMNQKFEEDRIEEQHKRKLKKLQGKDVVEKKQKEKGNSGECAGASRVSALTEKREHASTSQRKVVQKEPVENEDCKGEEIQSRSNCKKKEKGRVGTWQVLTMRHADE